MILRLAPAAKNRDDLETLRHDMTPESSATAGDFTATRTSSGLEVFVLPTRKFKTKLVRLHLRSKLSERNAARALVPNLLRRGTRRLPSMLAVSRALEGLYGTSWSSSVYKLGDEQVLSVRLDTVEERFLPGRPKVFEPALDVTHDLLFDPFFEGGRFPSSVFEQERRNHRREIEALYNDKLSWAFQRLLDTMFPGEPYGRPVLGTVAETDALTGDDVVAAWRDHLKTTPARVFAVGDFDPAAVVRFVEAKLPLVATPPDRARNGAATSREGRRPRLAGDAAPPRVVVEKDPVSQSKLVSGRLVDLANLGEREFDALRVFAGVLGGGFHSRLFQTVREKHSLAYFASASLDRIRGVLFTSCGIDAADRLKVTELVEQEIASLRSAPPRSDELEQTKRLIVSSSRGLFDSAGGMVDTLVSGLAAGRVRSLDQVCASIEAVTAQDVLAAAQRVQPLDVVYCLEGAAHHDEAGPAKATPS
jgi:predicted Zn-dependent peptidase